MRDLLFESSFHSQLELDFEQQYVIFLSLVLLLVNVSRSGVVEKTQACIWCYY